MSSTLSKIAAAFVILAALFTIWACNANNVQTPAGSVGYLIEKPFFGQAKFVGTQVGPTSSGKSWRLFGNNLSITPYNNNEYWKSSNELILAEDKLPLVVEANIIWSIKPDKVKEFMESYGGLEHADNPDEMEKEAYDNFIRNPFRNIVFQTLAMKPGLSINSQLADINKTIFDAMKGYFADSPFIVSSALVSSCSPPQVVVDEISKKVASEQELKRQATLLEIAAKKEEIQKAEGRAEAAKEIEIAEGKAKAANAINRELTPTFLQYRAIEAMNSAQKIYIPIGQTGIPLVGSLDLGKDVGK